MCSRSQTQPCGQPNPSSNVVSEQGETAMSVSEALPLTVALLLAIEAAAMSSGPDTAQTISLYLTQALVPNIVDLGAES